MNLCLLIIPSFYTHFQYHMITLANLTGSPRGRLRTHKSKVFLCNIVIYIPLLKIRNVDGEG
jgi:hypothetical protein